MHITEPLVSIIVPIYNTEKYLQTCLDSIISQTYKNLEILLINDGSSDDSELLCLSYRQDDPRIIYIAQENKGISYTRNLALNKMTGDYLLFVDSDDWLETTMVETLVRLVTTFHVHVAACDHINTKTANCKSKKLSGKEYLISGKTFAHKMLHFTDVHCYPWGRLFSKEIFSQYRFPEGKIFEDVFIIPQVVYSCPKIALTTAQLCYYRKRNDGLSHRPFSLMALHEMDAYVSITEFADEKDDRILAWYTMCYFVTKYYVYKYKIKKNSFDLKQYICQYSQLAHTYMKRIALLGIDIK